MVDASRLSDLASRLNPIDDIFFRKMAEHVPFCEEILRVILEDSKLTVTEAVPQYSGTNLQGRSVVLDLKCTLGNGKQVNVEIQKADDDDHQRRVRYNGAVLTTNTTEPGTKFKEVPDVIVVYISRFDVYDKQKTIYHVDRVLRETGDVVTNGFDEIYINATIDDGSDIAELMRIFTEDNAYSEKFPVTSARKRQFKVKEEVDDMTVREEIQQLMDEERAEGRAEGMAEGKSAGKLGVLTDLVKEGLLTISIAAKKAGMTEEAFRKVAML